MATSRPSRSRGVIVIQRSGELIVIQQSEKLIVIQRSGEVKCHIVWTATSDQSTYAHEETHEMFDRP